MKTKSFETTRDQNDVSRTLAPEDVHRGQYIAVLNQVLEVPSFLWDCDHTILPPDELVRLKICSQDPGYPYRVIAACVPFVCLRGPRKETRTIDLRQTQVVELSKSYGKRVWKVLQQHIAVM